MKIKKLVPEDIKDKKLEYKVYRKVVKPALKAMMTMHLGEEATTGFIIKTNYEFADMKGKKMGLIIPGDQTSSWLKFSKEEIKNDKKNTCLGQCYVKESTDGPVLVLMPEKGAAKKNLMMKQLLKFALKGTPFKIEIGAGGELEEDNPAEAVVDDVEVVEEEEEAPVSVSDDQALGQQISALMKSIATTYKDKIKAVVVPRIKAGDPNDTHLKETEALLDQLDQMQELYSSGSEALQNKLKENALKIFALVPNLEKIKHKLNQMLGAESVEEETTEQPVRASSPAEALELSKKLMNEINAIAEELNIFAMA